MNDLYKNVEPNIHIDIYIIFNYFRLGFSTADSNLTTTFFVIYIFVFFLCQNIKRSDHNNLPIQFNTIE